ncbi:MAG: methylenetetrahydrofolate reductase C-terminal domain-containing protein [Dehalococcoidia bacterium]|nr:methylenetetrahydrofolate reductase C-terminal domain-containing protein [Dehalococcoidia bacterium]
MIVGERKPFEEIKGSIQGYKKVLIMGCGTCVSVCMAGGEKEVELLASQLRMANKLAGNDQEIGEETIQRQCDREYIEPVMEKAKKYDAVLSMACGAGVQLLADILEPMPVLPGLNTRFIGVAEAEGTWSEQCRACGNCVLANYGGICPIARCPKSILNGPCGGSQNGKCETSKDRDCAWALIYERLKKQGRLANIMTVNPPKDFRTQENPGRVVNEAYVKPTLEETHAK